MNTSQHTPISHIAAARSALPSLAVLSLSGPHAHQDLLDLGWWNEQSLDILWDLGGVGDPQLALNSLVRLFAALKDLKEKENDSEKLSVEIRENATFRMRLFCLLGASAALGDYLIANPASWPSLANEAPTRTEMFHTLLSVVEAQPAEIEVEEGAEYIDPATTSLDRPGTYRAAFAGQSAERALSTAYTGLLMRIAAHDVAGTFAGKSGKRSQPRIEFRTITHQLSDLADAALTAALAVAVRSVYKDLPVDSRLAVMAMGKCGARELNYISDVDVIFVAEPANTHATRTASELIRTGCRCFFDVDAALRPEGKRGALVRTLESHRSYYSRWAQTWEFQALLKHRPMTGNMALGHAYSEQLSPMVWSASQREDFVGDIQAMRRRVLDNVPDELKERELKLGEGGLRDVEFAVQLLQLVHGRSDESLRTLATVDALHALITGGYIGREDGRSLIQCYEFLRLLEHRLQLQKVRRTHTLPAAEQKHALRWLARAAGFQSSLLNSRTTSSTGAMLEELRTVRLKISTLHRQLFYRPLLDSVVNLSVDQIKLSPEAAQLQLAALGYKSPARAFEHLKALAAGNTRRAKIQAMLLPTLLEWLSGSADPDAGLLNYRKLSEQAMHRTWFLRLLRDEGIVGKRLMHIFGNSPFTAELIISAPDIIKQLGDGATGPKLLEVKPGSVSQALVRAAARQTHPERAIQVARSLRRSELARIASADLLGLMEVVEVCQALSGVWTAVLEAALQAEIAASMPPDGVVPARIAVIGMGRLGGAELGYGSDADVMFVSAANDGSDEHEALRWAGGVCERMRKRLAKPSGDPPLDVDLGLRPEGRSGAVVRTLESYHQYYSRWGETWEIQALLRARWVAGDAELGSDFIAMVDRFRYPDGGVDQSVIRDIRRMKARIDHERLPRGADRHTHTKLGRGGLGDIEWTVQLLTLMHADAYPDLKTPSTLKALEVIARHQLISPAKVSPLVDAWTMATNARNATVLVRGKRADQLPPPGPGLAQVAGAAGWDPEDSQGFLEEYLKLTRRAHNIVDEVFWGESLGDHQD
ncbi:bifunctional [glutamine synthetase] adenylyltransferase/[glutamine synthetase]-adenylyl-L-tyrosine phosphorylase [Corynebacterium sp. ES2775-CONJ]|uniref:bifunctional [glutamine synthetase] adenylyltransferase/[glutamine synthetase]-adenylyl-L-tyrosine phosphorylase n=1 Tax=Corynebacterium sp. ES2775-CONJ TaxID=2974029 RepID=UPI002168A1F7|nr:bifunctional [glutamine synthetase] adenylyltransferase/[glutamine synthetase]-adenylyl-L-tyrosine phosphorylase [Corynebacterium sp. ES2775-CONJ]MCS4490766.1 bifunctional [glutamine synthetase] adenylyltransferase/[glutamine synthetase]-adenylyl-L-tyrosine phosphorylase [Corynebacterium sp. ES2775-CONJ]